MKSYIKWIVTALVLVAIIAGSSVLYNKLSENYKTDNLAPVTTTGTSGAIENTTYAAPDFTVLDNNGNKVKLSDFKGKPVILNFWATWCYYCKEEMPDFNKAFENHPDIQFMMVNATDGVQETIATAKDFIEKQGFGFDVFFDTDMEAVTNYGVTVYPMTFFIDANGDLVTYANGMIDYATLEKGIEMISK